MQTQQTMDAHSDFLTVRKQLCDFEVAEEEKKGNVLRKCSAASTNLRTSGNKLYRSKDHDKRTHENILSLYSESIAFAPVDSEELALAYSNRSALLLHLHYPEKSLIDIVKALGITKSTYLRTKLLSRKAKCLELIKKSADREDNSSDELKIPKFTPSKQLPCVADCVKVDYNKQFGRHMVATRDIEPGEVIIAETGHVVFPSGEQMYLNCSNCLRLAWTGIPCDFCAFAIFCSETCKKEAWNAYHDIECCIIPYIFLKQKDKSLLSHMMITARIFITAVKREGLEHIMHTAEAIDNQDIHAQNVRTTEEFNCTKFKYLYNLSSHDQDIIRHYGHAQYIEEDYLLSVLYKCTSIFSTFQKINSDNKELYVKMFSDIKKIIIKLRNVVSINNFGYQIVGDKDSDFDYDVLSTNSMKGLLLAPCSSFISHSCYPNVSKIFMPKRKMVMMTVLPVKKGEQLYCCYGPSITENVQERQAYLLKNYYFTCECEACNNNWTLESFNTLPQISEVDNFYKFVQDFNKLKFTRICEDLIENWSIDMETIKEVAEVCKVLSKNLKKHSALLYSFYYSIFLTNAFILLYQEKRHIPYQC
ncbi:SET and MYND domain-containing protein DDB_G0273591 [Nasonia vitripennis]|uniref:SET and MYND domain-containing protein 4 n=1 Tax=Nasonia vitripennis TaxID=7425 RepID=A0A7M7IRM5_NASVI|nr:SET and MYND domain-containing protein DDB_G0273591 [Nasonia vitripennis]XP_016839234.1 SET and MYND domain-containing protein DDB_G0273591 [Nasonia vitripennis]